MSLESAAKLLRFWSFLENILNLLQPIFYSLNLSAWKDRRLVFLHIVQRNPPASGLQELLLMWLLLLWLTLNHLVVLIKALWILKTRLESSRMRCSRMWSTIAYASMLWFAVISRFLFIKYLFQIIGCRFDRIHVLGLALKKF